jgi:N-acyl-D-amino-acid deacylase
MRGLKISALMLLVGCATPAALPPVSTPTYDLVLRGGSIIDGSGAPAQVTDIAITGDKIAYIGSIRPRAGKREINVRGKTVTPGFINLLSWGTESLLVDGRGQSDVLQGVTLELFGEGTSMGPLTPAMQADMIAQQSDMRFDVPWRTLGEYLAHMERKGVSPNVASLIGAATARINVMGKDKRAATAEELQKMQALVRAAMTEGAFGVGSSLIYAPGNFASTEELQALARAAGEMGGVYMSHIRSEGERFDEASDEFLAIARACGCRAQIYHLKAAGKNNWKKQRHIIAKLEAARTTGLPVAANAYPYVYGATGFDAAMPTWVQAGGLDAWIARLKDPAIRARVLKEMRAPAKDWENLYRATQGPQDVILLSFRNPALKKYTGQTLAQVSKARKQSPEDTIVDLVIEDRSRVGAAYKLMSEKNVESVLRLPWVGIGSDEGAESPEGDFLKSQPHPRAYGSFARFLGYYARDRKVATLPQAVYRLTGQSAAFLGLTDRGLLKPGYHADLVVFDANQILDRATFAKPQQFAVGVEHVWVNGVQVVRDSVHTGATPGRFVKGPAANSAPR